MSRLQSVGLAVALVFGIAGCNSSGPPAVKIQITPTSATVTPGGTAQFGSTVIDTSNTAVTWEVNGTAGGDGTHGTISTNGLYSAPASVPSPNTVTVTAVSKADTTRSASATVTIQAQVLPVQISPTTVTVAAGSTFPFTATQNGQPSTNSVTWSVSCKSTAAGACGSITSGGIFTAPLSPPIGGTVSVTATSQNGSQTAVATVTITWGSASLTGQYAFELSGSVLAGFEIAAGSFTADGNGNVTSGNEDVTQAGSQSFPITGGTYTIGTDGRGSATIQTSGGGSMTWQFVMTNNSHGFIVRTDSGTLAGTIDAQTPAQFNTAAISGPYALSLAGVDAGNVTLAAAGAFSASSAVIPTSGKSDTNDAGVPAPPGGLTGGPFSAPDANGRGTVSLTIGASTKNFVFYMVDATRLKLIQTDASSTLAGEIDQQTGSFTNASLAGQYAFAAGGTLSMNPIGEGGIFILDGKGNVSQGGTIDVNTNGIFTTGSITGTYSVSDPVTGRTALTFSSAPGGPLNYVLYPKASGNMIVLETDTSVVSGLASVQPAGTNFSINSFQGSYASSLHGSDLRFHPGREAVTGQINFALQLNNTASEFVSGTLDINDAGVVSPGIALLTTGSPPCALSCFSVSSNGRGQVLTQTRLASFDFVNLNLYAVDPSDAFFLETDSGTRVLVGEIHQQQ